MSEGGEQRTQVMQPNFVLMKLPGEVARSSSRFCRLRQPIEINLIGWIAGRSDGEKYGTSVVYNFPKTKLVDGPLQIEARIDQNAQLQDNSRCGISRLACAPRALLVIPTGKALLYAEPIYLQAERSPMPELRLVVLALQDRLAYGPPLSRQWQRFWRSRFVVECSVGGCGAHAARVAESNAPQAATISTD